MSKVKLSKRKREELIKKYGHVPTKNEIFQKIIESQERLAQVLKGAWESAPNDQKVKETLLEAGEKSAKLRSKIKKIFNEKK